MTKVQSQVAMQFVFLLEKRHIFIIARQINKAINASGYNRALFIFDKYTNITNLSYGLTFTIQFGHDLLISLNLQSNPRYLPRFSKK